MNRLVDIVCRATLFLFPILVLQACSSEPEQTEFIARVGSSYLRESDLLEESETPADSLSYSFGYVNQWIAAELVYQEAMRRNLRETTEVQEKLKAAERQLIINALLDEELFGDSSPVLIDSISSYYLQHQDEFTLRHDVALVSFVLFDDRASANSFRSGIVRGTPWTDRVAEIPTDSALSAHLLQVSEKQYVTRSHLYPDELWKVARSLKKDRVSFVVSTDSGYYVILLHEFRRQGETADLRYVEEEIRGRIVIRARRQKYELFLEELRNRFPVEVRLGALTADPLSDSDE